MAWFSNEMQPSKSENNPVHIFKNILPTFTNL